MNHFTPIGLGEIVFVKSITAQPKSTRCRSHGGDTDDEIGKVVRIMLELEAPPRYVVRYQNTSLGRAEEVVMLASELVGDPEFDQELGAYPDKRPIESSPYPYTSHLTSHLGDDVGHFPEQAKIVMLTQDIVDTEEGKTVDQALFDDTLQGVFERCRKDPGSDHLSAPMAKLKALCDEGAIAPFTRRVLAVFYKSYGMTALRVKVSRLFWGSYQPDGEFFTRNGDLGLYQYDDGYLSGHSFGLAEVMAYYMLIDDASVFKLRCRVTEFNPEDVYNKWRNKYDKGLEDSFTEPCPVPDLTLDEIQALIMSFPQGVSTSVGCSSYPIDELDSEGCVDDTFCGKQGDDT